jgi:hypothetical protein
MQAAPAAPISKAWLLQAHGYFLSDVLSER